MKNQVYNVGLSNANLSKLELCNFIKKYLNDFVFFEDTFNKDPDQRNYIVSNKKIENTGFIPKYSLDYGIKELIKGYKYLKKIITLTFNMKKRILIKVSGEALMGSSN